MSWVTWNALCRPKTGGGLRFRDLKCFNMELIAKQSWRVISNPSSLMAQVLKAKCFPNELFSKARKQGNAPSIWKGIWDSRCILERGSRWRIGNGQNLSVWTDRWISKLTTFKPYSPCMDESHCA